MCLDIRDNQRKDKEGKYIPSVAKKDIICYKWVERGYYNRKLLLTPYYCTIVRIGQVMKVKSLEINWSTVGRGIHGFTTLKTGKIHINCSDDVLIRCIIPKGTEYIKGEGNEIVATKMKLKKMILTKDDNGNFVNLERKKKK